MTLQEVKDNIRSGELTLSFSAMKSFDESPSHFVMYKDGTKKTTDAMKFGTVTHTLTLEPKKFDKEFIVFFKPFPDKTMALGANKDAYKQAQIIAEQEGKEVIKEEDVTKAKVIRDLAWSNHPSKKLLAAKGMFEKSVRFDFEGFTFRGKIDKVSPFGNVDLKKVPDANPRKLKWVAMDRKFAWQAFLYNYGLNKKLPYRPFFFICADAKGGITVLKILPYQLQAAELQLKKKIAEFKLCAIEDNWHKNYDFHGDNEGHYIIN